MKKFKHLNEQDEVYSEQHAKELLNVKADYNKKLQELNNQLAKKISDLQVKYLKIAQAQQQFAQTQKAAAKVAGTQTPTTQPTKTTGTVNTAGQPVTSAGAPATTQESYGGILKVKNINEETFDTRDVDSEKLQDLKNYMDAENIPYVEDEDQTSLYFDKDQLDPEWQDELEDLGLEKTGDVETDDILDVEDEDEEDWEQEEREKERTELNAENDIIDKEEQVNEDKVFYVDVHDADGDFVGKIYKLFDDGDWRAKIVDGESETFEKLNYDPDFDIHDILAFLKENYDDAELINKDEFNEHIENPAEVEEALAGVGGNGNILTAQDNKLREHHIPTFEDFLNETD
jgi:hypothetical protein